MAHRHSRESGNLLEPRLHAKAGTYWGAARSYSPNIETGVWRGPRLSQYSFVSGL